MDQLRDLLVDNLQDLLHAEGSWLKPCRKWRKQRIIRNSRKLSKNTCNRPRVTWID